MTNTSGVELLATNVALPVTIGERHGDSVLSGIRKKPSPNPTIEVTVAGLVGDGQGDVINHGGFDKAVYAYPAEHFSDWSREHGIVVPYGPGTFGENLTVRGLTEHDVYIGDRWKWGAALLEVCQPRFPCYKLGIALRRPSVVKEMVENGRTGWYLRVLQAGIAPTSGRIEVVERGPGRITVTEVHLARLPASTRDERRHVAQAERLARGLRNGLLDYGDA